MKSGYGSSSFPVSGVHSAGADPGYLDLIPDHGNGEKDYSYARLSAQQVIPSPGDQLMYQNHHVRRPRSRAHLPAHRSDRNNVDLPPTYDQLDRTNVLHRNNTYQTVQDRPSSRDGPPPRGSQSREAASRPGYVTVRKWVLALSVLLAAVLFIVVVAVICSVLTSGDCEKENSDDNEQCMFGEWQTWSPCDVTCGQGQQVRERNATSSQCAKSSRIFQHRVCRRDLCQIISDEDCEGSVLEVFFLYHAASKENYTQLIEILNKVVTELVDDVDKYFPDGLRISISQMTPGGLGLTIGLYQYPLITYGELVKTVPYFEAGSPDIAKSLAQTYVSIRCPDQVTKFVVIFTESDDAGDEALLARVTDLFKSKQVTVVPIGVIGGNTQVTKNGMKQLAVTASSRPATYFLAKDYTDLAQIARGDLQTFFVNVIYNSWFPGLG